MAKKSFKGIEAILNGNPEKKAVPKDNNGIIRTTFRLREDLIEQIKAIAYWERSTTTAIITDALQQFIASKGKNQLKEALDIFREHSPKT